MKKTLLLSILVTLLLQGHTQVKKPVVQTNSFTDALNKVVADYKNNFRNIQGEKLPAEVEAETFRSKVCLPEAVGCRVMRYHSVEDHSASWQAGIYSGESYDEALKKYKKIFSLVKGARVSGPDKAGNSFEGQMEKTDENVRFAVSTLRLKTNDASYKDLVAEAELTSNYSGWEVHLNIYTKKQNPKKEGEDE